MPTDDERERRDADAVDVALFNKAWLATARHEAVLAVCAVNCQNMPEKFAGLPLWEAYHLARALLRIRREFQENLEFVTQDAGLARFRYQVPKCCLCASPDCIGSEYNAKELLTHLATLSGVTTSPNPLIDLHEDE